MSVAIVVVLGLAMAARAQDAQPVLKGPTVSEHGKATLVEQDLSGRLKRLEVPPEEAALKLITIDDQAKARTDRVLAERAALLDKAVIENLELIVRIHSAGQSGDKADALELFREFAKHLEPLKARGKLVEEVKTALPEDQRETYAALVKEYHEAAVKDAVASSHKKLTLREAVGREVLQAVGREIKRSYDRQIAARTADYEELLASLELKPEQETRIRNMVTDHVQATKANPTRDQKKDLFWRIYGELNSDQRARLVAHYRGKA